MLVDCSCAHSEQLRPGWKITNSISNINFSLVGSAGFIVTGEVKLKLLLLYWELASRLVAIASFSIKPPKQLSFLRIL